MNYYPSFPPHLLVPSRIKAQLPTAAFYSLTHARLASPLSPYESLFPHSQKNTCIQIHVLGLLWRGSEIKVLTPPSVPCQPFRCSRPRLSSDMEPPAAPELWLP